MARAAEGRVFRPSRSRSQWTEAAPFEESLVLLTAERARRGHPPTDLEPRSLPTSLIILSQVDAAADQGAVAASNWSAAKCDEPLPGEAAAHIVAGTAHATEAGGFREPLTAIRADSSRQRRG